MDVICDQCKAEYDFDEALLGEKGTTVKCSRCGHVFRVAPPTREGARATLQLRFASDGRVVPLASLRELQQRIGAGEVTRDDELGREGFPFRKLAEVPELKNFFPPLGGQASARAPQRTVMGLGPAGAPARKPAEAASRAAVDTGEAPTLPATPAHVVRGEPAPGPSSLPPPNVRLPPAQLTTRGVPPSVAAGAPPSAEHAPISTAPTRPAAELPRAPEPARVPERTPVSFEPVPQRPVVPQEPTPPRAPVSFEPFVRTPQEPTQQRAPGSGAPTAKGPAPVRLALDTAEAIEGRPSAARHTPASAPGGMARDTMERLERPGALAQAMAQAGGAPAPTPSVTSSAPAGSGRSSFPRVKLRMGLGDDDGRERSDGGSKLPYIAGGAVLLAAASWAGLSFMTRAPERTEAVIPTPQAIADAALAAAPDGALEDASLPGDAGAQTSAAPTPSAPAKPLEATAPGKEAEKPRAEKPAEPKPTEKADRAEKAEKPAAKAASEAKADAKDYAGLVARGDQMFAKGDLPGARQAYSDAIALRASGSEANSGLGFVLLAQGQLKEAVPVLSRAAASGYAEASIGLGDAQRKLGNKDDAIEAYETYIARMPNGPRAKYARAQLEALSGGSSTSGSRARDTEDPQNAPSNDFRPAGEPEAPSGNRAGSGSDTNTMDEPAQ